MTFSAGFHPLIHTDFIYITLWSVNSYETHYVYDNVNIMLRSASEHIHHYIVYE